MKNMKYEILNHSMASITTIPLIFGIVYIISPDLLGLTNNVIKSDIHPILLYLIAALPIIIGYSTSLKHIKKKEFSAVAFIVLIYLILASILFGK